MKADNPEYLEESAERRMQRENNPGCGKIKFR